MLPGYAIHGTQQYYSTPVLPSMLRETIKFSLAHLQICKKIALTSVANEGGENLRFRSPHSLSVSCSVFVLGKNCFQPEPE